MILLWAYKDEQSAYQKKSEYLVNTSKGVDTKPKGAKTLKIRLCQPVAIVLDDI